MAPRQPAPLAERQLNRTRRLIDHTLRASRPRNFGAKLRCETVTSRSLAFFNALSGELRIELSSPTTTLPGLENEAAPPTATIKSIQLVTDIFERENDTFRELTAEELSRVVFEAGSVVLRGQADMPVRHRAPNGIHFTVRELLAAVEETERQTRGHTGWFDGINVHHVFFEGIRQTSVSPTEEWTIDWGS